MKNFDGWVGNKLAFGLSTMAAFYIVSAIVLVPLIWVRPEGVVGWIQYMVQSFFQGSALPVLGYVARVSGERNERVIVETYNKVSEELAEIKKMHEEADKWRMANDVRNRKR